MSFKKITNNNALNLDDDFQKEQNCQAHPKPSPAPTQSIPDPQSVPRGLGLTIKSYGPTPITRLHRVVHHVQE